MSTKIFCGLLAICFTSGVGSLVLAADEKLVITEGNKDIFLWKSDFKYRFQSIKEEGKDPRGQQRLQAKLTLEAKPQPDFNLYFQLQTASSATSSSQTLGDADAPGMPRRAFGLNWAYFDNVAEERFNLLGGKMPSPYTFGGNHQVLLDRDLALEGLALKSNWSFSENLRLRLTAGEFLIKEQYDTINNKDLTDNQLNAWQANLEFKKDIYQLTLCAGAFSFINFRDFPPAITGNAGKANTDSHNNTIDLNGNFPYNFDIKEQSIELKTNLGPEVGTINVFYASLRNEDASLYNLAQVYGLTYQIHAWTFGWQQLKVEKDAVVGAYMDSDFNSGNTSAKGSNLSVQYKINRFSQVAYTQYSSLGQIDTDTPRTYSRSHLDYSISL